MVITHARARHPARTRYGGKVADLSISPDLGASQTHLACAKGRGNRKLPRSRTSVIPVVPPRLLLDTLLLLEQEAPVVHAMQDPSPGCRRQALLSGLIGAIAGVAELPTL